MSMEVFYRPSDQITIKLEVKDIEGVFKELGPLQEVFGSAKCGKCGCTKVRAVHRKPDKFDFYELLCEGTGENGLPCGAKLSLGKNEQGNLFPRRYEQDPDDPKKPKMVDGKKVWLKDNGWQKWDAKEGKYV